VTQRDYHHTIMSNISLSGFWISTNEETAKLVVTNDYKLEVCKVWHASSKTVQRKGETL
jgi:hypothetical protein